MKFVVLFATLLSYICMSENSYPEWCYGNDIRLCDANGKAAGTENNKICENYEDWNQRCWATYFGRNSNDCSKSSVGKNKCKCECTHQHRLQGQIGSLNPFQIIHKSSGNCLTRSKVNIFLASCNNANTNQQWTQYTSNGAVTSYDTNDISCMEVRSGITDNGQRVSIWEDNADCRNWEQSQWTFMPNGLIRSDIDHDKYLTVNDDWKSMKIEDKSNNKYQIFKFPDGAFRGSSLSNSGCNVDRLEVLTEDSTNELAVIGWNLGTAVAGELAGAIPVVGSAISTSIGIITSIWEPDFGEPSAEDLINDLVDEIDDIVKDLKQCLDAKIENVYVKISKDDDRHFVKQFISRMMDIEAAGGQLQITKVESLYIDARAEILTIFRNDLSNDADDSRAYAEYLPIYEQLLPLWSAISQEMLIVLLNANDCHNYQAILGKNRDRFELMKSWIENATESILDSGIEIVSGSSWRAEQESIFKKKYVSPIENFIEALDDVSPNLASVECLEQNNEGEREFPSRESPEDFIMTIYKYKRNNNEYDVTFSVSNSSEIIKSRGFTLTGESYQLYDKSFGDDTKPVYKKYSIENDDYFITLDANEGDNDNYNTVSVLGFCTTSDTGSSILLCDDLLNRYEWGLNRLPWVKHEGKFKQLSIGGDGLILGLDDQDGSVYKFDNNDWAYKHIAGNSKFQQISIADKHNIFGVGLNNKVYKSTDGGNTWHVLGADDFEMISAVTNDGVLSLWGLKDSGVSYRYINDENRWEQIPGHLSQISVGSPDNYHIWCIVGGGGIKYWRYKDEDTFPWIGLNSWRNAIGLNNEFITNIEFSHIDLSSDGAFWAIGNDNKIFRNVCEFIRINDEFGYRWIEVAGPPLKQIESENGKIIGVGQRLNSIYSVNDPYPKCDNLRK